MQITSFVPIFFSIIYCYISIKLVLLESYVSPSTSKCICTRTGHEFSWYLIGTNSWGFFPRMPLDWQIKEEAARFLAHSRHKQKRGDVYRWRQRSAVIFPGLTASIGLRALCRPAWRGHSSQVQRVPPGSARGPPKASNGLAHFRE